MTRRTFAQLVLGLVGVSAVGRPRATPIGRDRTGLSADRLRHDLERIVDEHQRFRAAVEARGRAIADLRRATDALERARSSSRLS